MNYTIRNIMYKGQVDDIVFDFDNKYELLSTFLSVEVSTFSHYIKEGIDRVECGKSIEERWSGNICSLIVHLDTTLIYDHLAKDGRGKACTIPTKELSKLMNEWLEARRKMKG